MVLDPRMNSRETRSQIQAREGIKRSLERKKAEAAQKPQQVAPVNYNALKKSDTITEIQSPQQVHRPVIRTQVHTPANYNALKPSYHNKDLESELKQFASS